LAGGPVASAASQGDRFSVLEMEDALVWNGHKCQAQMSQHARNRASLFSEAMRAQRPFGQSHFYFPFSGVISSFHLFSRPQMNCPATHHHHHAHARKARG